MYTLTTWNSSENYGANDQKVLDVRGTQSIITQGSIQVVFTLRILATGSDTYTRLMLICVFLRDDLLQDQIHIPGWCLSGHVSSCEMTYFRIRYIYQADAYLAMCLPARWPTSGSDTYTRLMLIWPCVFLRDDLLQDQIHIPGWCLSGHVSSCEMTYFRIRYIYQADAYMAMCLPARSPTSNRIFLSALMWIDFILGLFQSQRFLSEIHVLILIIYWESMMKIYLHGYCLSDSSAWMSVIQWLSLYYFFGWISLGLILIVNTLIWHVAQIGCDLQSLNNGYRE